MCALNLIEVMGCTPEECSDRLYHWRPSWVVGTVSHLDARYLFNRALNASTELVIEIGTASGVSTAFLCRALEVLSRGGEIGPDFEVRSYDLNPRFYADEGRCTGDATRDMLSPELARNITFRSPATALTVADEIERESVSFLFLDANHRHPWPALDLLAALAVLQPGAEVVLHDINLPVRQPETPDWGAKYLFDDLDVEKETDRTDPVPNIGSVWIPEDKPGMREQLLAIIAAHEWEADVWNAVTSRLLPDQGAGR